MNDREAMVADYPTALRSHVIGTYYGRHERLPLFLMLEVMELMTGAAAEIEHLQTKYDAFRAAYDSDAKEVAHWAKKLNIPGGKISSVVARMGMELESLRA